MLYGRIIDTMLATWGLSLLLVGLATAIFGNTTVGVSPPLGSFSIGAYRASGYTLFVIGVALAVMLALYLGLLRYTRFGLIARGTMQNPAMAAALGVDPGRVYAVTFGLGAALSGLAGGVLAPISGVLPMIGAAYIAKAFITVIGGGAAILAGTALGGDPVRRGQPGRHLPHHAGVRRGGAARRRHRPDPPAARRASPGGFSGGASVRIGISRCAGRDRDRRARRGGGDRLAARGRNLHPARRHGLLHPGDAGAQPCASSGASAAFSAFGQSAFFGLGGYAYALAVINFGESTVPLLLGIVVPMLFAALLGYFMFYGRISDVYLGVITLTVTLILFNLINSTSGPEYAHRAAHGSAAINGIPGMPPINMPGNAGAQLDLRRNLPARAGGAGAGLSRPALAAGEPSSAGCWSRSARTSCAPSCWATIARATSWSPS